MIERLDLLMADFPKHLWLELSSQEQAVAWQQAQDYSNDVACWNAYIHYICLNKFISWLQEEPDLQDSILVSPNPSSWLWELVTGMAIKLGETRLVLIPSEKTDIESFCVPQEWIDIPSWAADYYLGVQINLSGEECWMRVWGFTTHQKLREGKYDPIRRTYSLEHKDLIESLNVIWVAKEICPEKKPVVEPLPIFSSARVEQLLEQLGKPTAYSPRLEVPFEQWAAIIEPDERRWQLYCRRMGKLPVKATSVVTGRVNLNQWLHNLVDDVQHIIENGWQSVEKAVDEMLMIEENLAYRSVDRSEPAFRDKAVPVLIDLLQTHSKDKTTRLRTLDLLGEIAYGDRDAIACLTKLIETADNNDIRRQASVTLGKIDPGNSKAGVRKAKKFDLGLRLDNHQVVLVVTLMPEDNRITNVNLRVYPTIGQAYLPPDLELIVFDDEGEILPPAKSRHSDKAIQLGIKCQHGDCFSVKIKLGDTSFTEDFFV